MRPGRKYSRKSITMKITLITLIALAAAPLAGLAADKEVQTHAKSHIACQKSHRQQVALFVQGNGVADNQTTPKTMTIFPPQTGQGASITFFTGSR